MRYERKIIHEGRPWYGVPAAARTLHTTTAKVREHMGKEELEWTQQRRGGKLMVSIESILQLEKTLPKRGGKV
jgi:hypothetical protein